jgi:hypothetical protein
MKYAAVMGSDAMIYIPGFVLNGSGKQKFIRRDPKTQRHTGWGSYKPALGK